MDLGQFIQENCTPLYEGLRIRDIAKATQLIRTYLGKRKIYTAGGQWQFKIDGGRGIGVLVFNDKNEGACFYWSLASTATIAAVGFTKDFNKVFSGVTDPTYEFQWDVYVQAKGTNVVQMCKLVEAVLTGKVKMDAAAIRAEIQDAQLFESVSGEEMGEQMLTEATKDPKVIELERKKSNLYQRLNDARKKGKDTAALEAEYAQIVKELTDARTNIRTNVSVSVEADTELEQAIDFFEDEMRATPEERFDDMKNYIYNVIAGRKPLALLCGAPGVGKTFRVMQAVKGTGKQQGSDYKLLKGKSTPTNLYMALHDYKEKGQLIIMDDCDSVFKDPDAINLLKAAFDSSDERWVTWGTAAPIPMPAELAEMCDDAVFDEVKQRWYYPKEFLFEGGGIIITNYAAGQIDTAIRNRALICDLSFTVQEVLDLIRGIAPKIKPDELSTDAKDKALDYLQYLADRKAPVELSIRSFTMCASLYMSDCPDNQIKRMINEQMRLQFARGGKKY